MLSYSEVLDHFQGKQQKINDQSSKVCCPRHNDTDPSLVVSVGKNGGYVFDCKVCHGSCSDAERKRITEEIITLANLTWSDVTPTKEKSEYKRIFDREHLYRLPNGDPYKKKTVYKYKDQYNNYERKKNGDLKKDCPWFACDRTGKVLYKGLTDPTTGEELPHYPYRAGDPKQFVFITEGEKDADTIANFGFYAISPENGAKEGGINGSWYPETYSQFIIDRDVRILLDNDHVGHTFGEAIAQAVYGLAKSVKVFDLTTVYPNLQAKGDITDLCKATGREATIKYLDTLERITDVWCPAPALDQERGSEDILNMLECTVRTDRNGEIVSRTPKKTPNNCRIVLENDPYFSNIRYNVLTGQANIVTGNTHKPWSESKEAVAVTEMDKKYHVDFTAQIRSTFKILMDEDIHPERRYNPILEKIESVTWDGQPRVEHILTKWLGAPDDPDGYVRECSRLIFAGGINRLRSPGCKFEAVVTLIGGQGAGKSTFCKLLALDKEYYSTVKTIHGKEGSEEAEGVWIAEVEELLAVVANTKSGTNREEEVKAYISRETDRYRRPYAPYVTSVPRSCIFIGTTNQDQFLTDPTGNRRWYPVKCNCKENPFFDPDGNFVTEAENDILQAWAEINQAFIAGDPLARPYENKVLLDVIRKRQKSAEVEDPTEDAIIQYAEKYGEVSVYEIMTSAECLDMSKRDLLKADKSLSNKIANILKKNGYTHIEQHKVAGKNRKIYSKEIVTTK